MRSFNQTRFSAFSLASALILGACSAPPGGPISKDDQGNTGGRSGGDGDGDIGDGDNSVPGAGGNGDGDNAGTGGITGDGDLGDGDAGDGDVMTPDGTLNGSLLPARIRRLTNAEYTKTVQALLGTTMDPGATFPPDTRQQGYTVNEAQRVDPLLAKQLDKVATDLATEAAANLDTFAPCADPAGGGVACANTFAGNFAPKAYRRPLESGELEELMTLYAAGAEGGSYSEGIQLMVRGILQTPAFLFLTEIGDGSESGTVPMTAYELASALSYLLTGGPPDETLLAAAKAGQLATADDRESEARRLLSENESGARLVRIVREWLGVDRIVSTAKDSNLYPQFDGLRDAMGAETDAFVRESLAVDQGNVSTLLGADLAVASAPLATFYDANGQGPERLGLLNQAAFLSVYAHAHETGPVLRGVAVMRRVACLDIELPTNLVAEIIPPVPDPEKTTRERFSIHSADAGCQSCHTFIDPIGFSFENLDAMGGFRTTENGKPVDSSSTIGLRGDFDGPVTNSNDLARALSTSADVRTCFARQLFRATAGEGEGADDSEDAFVKSWSSLPESDQGSLIEILVALSRSNLFSHRGEQ